MVSRRGLFKLSLVPAFALTELGRAAVPKHPEESFKGKERFKQLLDHALANDWQKLPIGELVGKTGYWLKGTPYVGHTLELSENKEICSVDLLGLDCVTLFENSLDFARMLLLGGRTPQAMLDQIQLTRYRSGVVNGYTSRLHYTMDWIHDNVKKKVVKELTPELPGAVPHKYPVSFMSTHPELYLQLKNHPQWVEQMKHYEAQISARPDWLLPMDKVEAAEPYLQSGDIVGVVEHQPGIDIGHTGLVYKGPDGKAGFMNASSLKSQMQVTVGYPFHEAVNWSGKNVGVVIARPLKPVQKRTVSTRGSHR